MALTVKNKTDVQMFIDINQTMSFISLIKKHLDPKLNTVQVLNISFIHLKRNLFARLLTQNRHLIEEQLMVRSWPNDHFHLYIKG